MTAYNVFIGIAVQILVVGLVGGYAGFAVDGVPVAPSFELVQPGLLDLAVWVWNSIQFMWCMVTFQIDGMPAFISAYFLLISMTMLFVIVKLVRGS